MAMPDGFPERLKRIRKSRGLTQSQLGEIIGIATCLVSEYERGVHLPRIDTLEWFCQALNVSSKDLLGF